MKNYNEPALRDSLYERMVYYIQLNGKTDVKFALSEENGVINISQWDYDDLRQPTKTELRSYTPAQLKNAKQQRERINKIKSAHEIPVVNSIEEEELVPEQVLYFDTTGNKLKLKVNGNMQII